MSHILVFLSFFVLTGVCYTGCALPGWLGCRWGGRSQNKQIKQTSQKIGNGNTGFSRMKDDNENTSYIFIDVVDETEDLPIRW